MDKLHSIIGYTYASPRYHVVKNATAAYEDEDYQRYDKLNGTYDKNWPCYSVTVSDPPESVIVDIEGNEVLLRGDLSLFLYKDDYHRQIVGSVGYLNPIVNTNLDKKEVSFALWLQTKINPGWTNLQLYGDNINYTGFLIRCLSTWEIIKENHSVDITDAEGQSSTQFPKGIIVNVENKVYKCINPTYNYPDPQGVSTDWINLNSSNFVFTADFYVLTSQGESVYFDTFSDQSRRFDPKNQEDDTLVSWNISAYYE